MAWLHAVPKPPEGSRRAKESGQAAKLSRLDRLKKDGATPRMPPNPMPHIIQWFNEIGVTEAAGMGLGPLSWQAIDAWVSRTCIDLSPWEARLMRKLSLAYVAESRRAESENCPAPWHSEATGAERKAEEARLRMVLG